MFDTIIEFTFDRYGDFLRLIGSACTGTLFKLRFNIGMIGVKARLLRDGNSLGKKECITTKIYRVNFFLPFLGSHLVQKVQRTPTILSNLSAKDRTRHMESIINLWSKIATDRPV